MYVILRQGGHQYRVSPGDVIQVEKIEVEKGETIELEDVLLIGTDSGVEIGEPRVTGASVKAKVLRQDKAKKIDVYKFKRRKGYERRLGHRQPFTEIKILGIAHNGRDLT